MIALAVLLTGCNKKASDEIDFGTLNNSVYQNKYFGLSITLPTDWSVQDHEAQQRLMKKGVKLVSGDDKNLRAIAQAAELQTVNLFVAQKHPSGAPVAYNPSIAGVAERVRDMPGIQRGRDYLFHAKKMLAASQMQVSFPKDYYAERLGGVEFDVMEMEMSTVGIVVKQKYYVAILKGYALCFIISFTDNDEMASLQNVLDTLKLK